MTPPIKNTGLILLASSLLGEIIGGKEVEHSLGLSDFRSARIVQPQSGDCRSADGRSTDKRSHHRSA